jgi:two-component system cell cycle response regulator CpdR
MKHTILVVDDDADVLDVIASMLEELGCDVVCAASGAEALDTLAANEKVSILITDINMPGTDGHELAERAIRIRPTLKVLQLSGRERRRDGFPMIRKPFSEDDLARVMRERRGCVSALGKADSAQVPRSEMACEELGDLCIWLEPRPYHTQSRKRMECSGFATLLQLPPSYRRQASRLR